MPGLVECTNLADEWCIIKLVQVILSASILCGCVIEVIMTIRMQGAFLINTIFFIELFMILSLVFSLLHCIFDPENSWHILLYLQLYFSNFFFLIIFYYVADNVLKQKSQRVALHIFCVVMIIFYTVIFVIRNIGVTCIEQKQIYMCVDCISIFVSLLLLVLFCKKFQQERKMQLFYSQNLVTIQSPSAVSNTQLNNPFYRMWVLISVNVFCGIISLTETVILYSQAECNFSSNININILIKFIFSLFDYYIGALVTLLVLRKIRIIQTQNNNPIMSPFKSSSFSIQYAEQNKLQLIANLSSRSSNY